MISQQAHGAVGHDQVDTFARVRTVADDITQAINFFDPELLDLAEDGLQRFEIAVDVADEGFQGSKLPFGHCPNTGHRSLVGGQKFDEETPAEALEPDLHSSYF